MQALILRFPTFVGVGRRGGTRRYIRGSLQAFRRSLIKRLMGPIDRLARSVDVGNVLGKTQRLQSRRDQQSPSQRIKLRKLLVLRVNRRVLGRNSFRCRLFDHLNHLS